MSLNQTYIESGYVRYTRKDVLQMQFSPTIDQQRLNQYFLYSEKTARNTRFESVFFCQSIN